MSRFYTKLNMPKPTPRSLADAFGAGEWELLDCSEVPSAVGIFTKARLACAYRELIACGHPDKAVMVQNLANEIHTGECLGYYYWKKMHKRCWKSVNVVVIKKEHAELLEKVEKWLQARVTEGKMRIKPRKTRFW